MLQTYLEQNECADNDSCKYLYFLLMVWFVKKNTEFVII